MAFALPLGLIALVSLSGGNIVGFPIGALGLRWYRAALADPDYRRSLLLSIEMAAGVGVCSVIAGTWIALAARSTGSPWYRLVLLGGALVPLGTPGIVHAVALRAATRVIGLSPGPWAILMGHTIHATPYAAIMVGARLAMMPDGVVDAARTLGAGPVKAFRHVTLPWLMPALLGAGGLAALSSFDDFIRSFFLGGYDQTLPVLIFGRLRSGLTPDINAMVTLVLLLILAAGVLVGWLRKSHRHPEG